MLITNIFNIQKEDFLKISKFILAPPHNIRKYFGNKKNLQNRSLFESVDVPTIIFLGIF